MGGNALKNITTRRYEKKEFVELSNKLVPKIKELFETEVALIKSYHSKEDFGDMDLLVLDTGLSSERIKELIQTLDPGQINRTSNSNVYSFDYEELQIDLIFTPEENWESSNTFFAYNDLGNLMGKIYHKFGLKYGFDGVRYIYRSEGKKLGEFVVTRNMRNAFEFIGLDYDRFLEGFDTMDDVFEYVTKSPYFTPESFYFENLNAINKNRNKKRKNYHLFVDYVNGTGVYERREKIQGLSYDDWDVNKSKYFQKIADEFPESNLFENLRILEKEEERKQKIKKKFNGSIIIDEYGFSGKELGYVIEKFKSLFDDFDEYVLSTDYEQIWKDFAMIDWKSILKQQK